MRWMPGAGWRVSERTGGRSVRRIIVHNRLDVVSVGIKDEARVISGMVGAWPWCAVVPASRGETAAVEFLDIARGACMKCEV